MITAALLTACALDPSWARYLNDACGLFDISTDEREAMWLAQCAHESQGFKALRENLNYGPSSLLAAWPKRFSPQQAVEYAHDQERIANRAYAFRNGNGDEESGDGWKFRAGGLLGLTFRDNYLRCGNALGIDLVSDTDHIKDPLYASLSAAWFWRSNGCNEAADAGSFARTTRIINGGLTGQEQREGWLSLIQRAQA